MSETDNVEHMAGNVQASKDDMAIDQGYCQDTAMYFAILSYSMNSAQSPGRDCTTAKSYRRWLFGKKK